VIVATIVATVAVASAVIIDGPARATPPAPPGAKASRNALANLVVAPRGSLAGYSRARFGGGWASAGEGCDTRDRVLLRDGAGVQTGAGCRLTGSWTSPYDGVVITVARDVDIDHVVPLGHAWMTGARGWSATKRKQFANDLADPQLVAVTEHSNRSKGDSPPDEWKPPRHAIWCVYARWWIDIKTVWQLTVTGPERTALRAMLRGC